MKVIVNKTDTMQAIQTKLGGDIEEILRVLYVDKNLSVKHIASTLGISYVTAHKWLSLAGIRSRRIKMGS